ncbi:MAG: hypothetical protein IJ485_02040 [Lachnospiraceae bacterium]|nr:hypothetical protein [Lachnospiraceae bacterium]
MENYIDFLERIHSFEKKEADFGKDYFHVSPAVVSKVGTDNQYKEFYGDTVVFDLDADTKKKVSEYVDELYKDASECFCEQLDYSTFHVTLHDLSNSPVLCEVADEVFENEIKIVKEVRAKIKPQIIRMKTKCVFNMVDISLVLGLYPADEEEHRKLFALYDIVDGVKQLSYPLTPHITLAYYNCNGFDASSARKLEKIIRRLNDNTFEIILDTKRLYYQKFTSMNDYINILNLSD